MNTAAAFTFVDPDYYVPPEQYPVSSEYRPSNALHNWQQNVEGIWTVWVPPNWEPVEQGWKIHVSAQYDRIQHVLNAVADVCNYHEVTFKHLRAEWFFLLLHHKHGNRLQSGKFITIYPT